MSDFSWERCTPSQYRSCVFQLLPYRTTNRELGANTKGQPIYLRLAVFSETRPSVFVSASLSAGQRRPSFCIERRLLCCLPRLDTRAPEKWLTGNEVGYWEKGP